MFHRAGVPCHYTDLCYFIAPKTLHTGTAIVQLGAYGALFVKEQYNTDGSVFNFDGTYEPSTTVNGNFESVKLPVPLQAQLWTDFVDLGNDKEQYRSPFDIRYGERADDFSGIIRLCRNMSFPQAQFDSQISGALAVDEALRLAALTILCGIGDIYFIPGGLPHNLRLFLPADGGPAHFLPWDMDFVFTADSASSIYPGQTSNLYKLINNPGTKRIYLSHVNDLCQSVFNSPYMAPWLAHYGSVVGQNYTGGSSYIQNRANFALNQLPAKTSFALTSNGGTPFLTNSPMATITGTGWLDIQQIQLAGSSPNVGLASAVPVTWITVTNWQATVPLILGTNLLTFMAYGRTNNLIGTASISVTTTASNGGVDSDADGMPDAWELANDLNPFVNDAALDKDGDGVSNLQEYLAGTNPSDAQSFLRIDATSDALNVRLTFFAVAGRSYSVVYRDEAATGPWTKLIDVAARATNRVAEMLVPKAGPPQQRFYRLICPQQP